MEKHPTHELLIRSKQEMLQDIAQIIHFLHTGQRSAADLLIEDLKLRSLFFDDSIQQDVLVFSEQVHFQYDYDPWHKITPDVERAADKLIHHLGYKIKPD